MDDEFSEFFLLNDCLISGRLSPGPPDDFLSHGTHDTILLDNSGEVASNYLTFSSETDYGYSSGLSHRSSSTFVKRSIGAVGDNSSVFASVKSEELVSPLSSSGQSPDHDYINENRGETTSESMTENGGGSYSKGDICSSNVATPVEYSLGTAGDGNIDDNAIADYDVTDYYCTPSKAESHRVADSSRIIVAASHAVNGSPVVGINGFLLSGVTSDASRTTSNVSFLQLHGDSHIVKSEIPEEDAWTSRAGFPREDDVAPSGDDNSSTTSGESCSNCEYMNATSPTPSHASSSAYSQHQPNNVSRYRSIQPSNAAAMSMNLRARSKMHELALKHNLISDQDPRSRGYVLLSAEERRTLIQEGLPVPTKLPLSKQEEEALKVVRRKIKNKLSAQESRRKRKEYMETLEHQIEGYQTENLQLRRRIEALENTNSSLMGQVKRLQQQIAPNSQQSATTLVIGNGHGPLGDQPTKRGGANVHHTVSLAAVFILFVVMVPAMPVWPSIFRNAFVASSVFSKAIDASSPSSVYSDHSTLPVSRVLWSGDCDIPYSADYFDKLNECQQHEYGHDTPLKEISRSFNAPDVTISISPRLNLSEETGHSNELGIESEQLSAVAVCETVACRDVSQKQ